MKSGSELISEERQRQISEEGFTKEHDSQWDGEELAQAAATYAYPERVAYPGREEVWPEDWDLEWYKPTPDDRVRELVKAGALIAAEIDRIQNYEEEIFNSSEEELGEILRSQGYDPEELKKNGSKLLELLKSKLCQ